ncbi:MAG: GAF domain-containing protein [Anaerolineae bacterium]|nr:GAF domain-containing protein [Anaerolineae bacterium]
MADVVSSESTIEDRLLHQIVNKVTPTSTPTEWLEAVSGYARQLGAGAGFLGWIDSDSEGKPVDLEVAARWQTVGPATPEVHQHIPFRREWGLPDAWYDQPEQSTIIEDVLTTPHLDQASRVSYSQLYHVRAMAFLPMNMQGRWVSALVFCWSEPQQFSDEARRIFNSIIQHGGPIINAIRLFEQNRERAIRAELLNEVNTALSLARDEEDILKAVALYAQRFNAHKIVLMNINSNAAGVPVEAYNAASLGPLALMSESQQIYPIQQTPFRMFRGFNTDQPLFIEDLWNDPQLDEWDHVHSMQSNNRALISLPLKAAGTWQGVILIWWSESRTFSDQERYMYARLLPTVASVVATRRAYLAQVEAEQEAALLYQLAQAVNAANTFSEVVQAVAILYQQADTVYLLNWENYDAEGARTFTIAATADTQGSDSGLVGQQFPADLFPIVHKMRGERQWFIEDTYTDERVDDVSRASWDRFNVRSQVVIHLYSQGRWFGSLTFSYSQPRRFSQKDRRLGVGIGDLITAAIERIWLQQETDEAIEDTDSLYKLAEEVNAAITYQEAIQAVHKLYPDAKSVHLSIGNNSDFAQSTEFEFLAVIQATDSVLPASGYRVPGTAFPLIPMEPNERLWAIENSQTDERVDAATRETYRSLGIMSHLVLPLWQQGRWFANLALGFAAARAFSVRERRQLIGAGDLLAAAVERIRSQNETVQANEENTLMYKLAESVNAATTYQDMIESVARLLPDCDGVFLNFWEHLDYDKATALRNIATAAVPESFKPTVRNKMPKLPALEAMRHEKLWVIEDVNTDPRLDEFSKASIQTLATVAFIAVPLSTGDRMWGVVVAHYLKVKHFTERERRVMLGIGELVQAAVERIQAEQETVNAKEESDFLYQLAQDVNAATTYQGVMDAVAKLQPEGDGVFLNLFENLDYDNATFLEITAAVAMPDNIKEGVGRQIPLKYFPIGPLIRDERSWEIEDIETDSRVDPISLTTWRRLEIGALMCVNLKRDNRFIGLLSFKYTHPHQYTERERRLALGIADLALAAVERIHAQQETNVAKEESDFLYQLAQDVNAAMTYQEIMDAVSKLQSDGDGVFLNLFENLDYDRASYLEIVAGAALPERFRDRIGKHIPLSAHPIGAVIRHERLWAIEDIDIDPRVDPISHATWVEMETRALICVNLKREDRFFGLLFFKYVQPHRSTDRERRLALGIADLVLAAVERIYAQQETTQAKEESDFLYQLAQDVNAATTYQEIMDGVSKLQSDGEGVFLNLFEHLDYDRASYLEYTAGAKVVDYFKSNIGVHSPLSAIPILAKVRHQHLWTVEDVRGDPTLDEVTRQRWESFNCRAALCVNLKREDRFFGLLFFRYGQPHHCTDSEKRLALGIADLVLAAVERIHAQQETNAAKEESDFLYQLSQNVNAAMTFQDIMDAVSKVQADGDGVFLNLFENLDFDNASYLEVVAGKSLTYSRNEPYGNRVPLSSYPISAIIRNERLWYVENVDHDDRVDPVTLATWKAMGIQAMLCVNLFRGERYLGLFFFEFQRPHRMTERERRLALGIADLTLAAVERILAQEETTIAKDESDFLYQLAQDVNAAMTYQEIMAAVSKLQSGGDGVFLNLFEHLDYDKASYIEITAGARVVPHFEKNIGLHYAVSALPILNTMRHEHLWTIDNVNTDPNVDVVSRATWEEFKTGAVMCVNLKREDRFFGLLFFKYGSPHHCTATERRLALGIADLVLAAVERIRLQIETTRARQQRELLFEASAAINASNSFIEVVNAVERLKLNDGDVHLILGRHGANIEPYYEVVAATEKQTKAQGDRLQPGAVAFFENCLESELYIFEDIDTDPQLTEGERTHFQSLGIRSVAGYPLKQGSRVLGSLSLVDTQPHHYSLQTRQFFEAVGRLVFAAVERIRLQQETTAALERAERLNEQIQRLAALEERNRLARELHDSVSQALYGIGLGAQTANAMWGRDNSVVKESLDYVLMLSEAALVEMRALIFELRPESIENEGLITALAKQGASLQARHGIDVRMELCAEPSLAVESKESVYRIAREALHNVIKHASATQITLRLSCTESSLQLDVVDNGMGFDPKQDFPGHLGLQSMRERVAQFGGHLDINSTVGKGTQLSVVLPFRSADN